MEKNKNKFALCYPVAALSLHQKYDKLFGFEVAMRTKDCGLF